MTHFSSSSTSEGASKRVLILSTSAGSGHIKAAEAIESAFKSDPRVSAIQNINALDYTNTLFREFYSTLYTTLVKNAPDFLGWWYKTSDEPWRTDKARLMLDRLNTKPLVQLINDFAPDITVCTHFMPAGIISHLIAEKKLKAHLSIVVTDFDFHAMWLSRYFHRYFVALEETKAHLELLGIPSERITISGIPVTPGFAEPVDRKAFLSSLNLSPTRTTLLLSAGTVGIGPAAFIVERLKTLKSDTQTIVLCGKNEELFSEIQKNVADTPEKFLVLGYTDEMQKFMHSSDLFIGKPGGLTTAECLACNLPMLIVDPIPGQEERNSDHLLENGIAIKCNDLTTLAFKIDRLLAVPEKLQTMREATNSMARPNAAQTIVHTLLSDDLPPISIPKDSKKTTSTKKV